MRLKKPEPKQLKNVLFSFRLNSNVKVWLDKVHKESGLSRGEIINQLLAQAIAKGIK